MNEQVYTYIENSKYPIRFDRLRHDSFFRIHAEPSRGIRRSKDRNIYWKSESGFFAVNSVTLEGAVLMPYDLVMPLKKVPYRGDK